MSAAGYHIERVHHEGDRFPAYWVVADGEHYPDAFNSSLRFTLWGARRQLRKIKARHGGRSYKIEVVS